MADIADVNHGQLSAIERGRQLPPDDWIEKLEAAYGVPADEWYPRRTLLVLRHEEDDEDA